MGLSDINQSKLLSPYLPTMVLSFQIDRIDTGLYRAVALRKGNEVSLPEAYLLAPIPE